MNPPTLANLPPPPPGKHGWPWTEASPRLPPTLPDGEPWPQISIVTPSFNQGQFLEETLRSVLLQGYPNLEYIVVDGGSTDGSVAILMKYQWWLSNWESAPDRGQASAINKGWNRATGEVFAWLNSDDLYCPGALQQVGSYFSDNPACQLLVGGADVVTEIGAPAIECKRLESTSLYDLIYGGRALPQPAAFWANRLRVEIGPLDEQLHFTMDREYFLRLLLHGIKPHWVPEATLALERRHTTQKTADRAGLHAEYFQVLDHYFRKRLGGRLINIVRMCLYSRGRAYRQSGWLHALRTWPSSREARYARFILNAGLAERS